MTVLVKICGIRSIDDALAAIDLGADLLGFNFYPASPRALDPATCRRVVAAIRGARRHGPVLVGVFVNLPIAEVANILNVCDLDLAQLHGDEPPEAVAMLAGRGFKALRPASLADAVAQVDAYRLTAPPSVFAPALLLDAAAVGVYGGSGQVADWSVAAAVAADIRLLLAGGLHPGNVAQAIRAVRPWGVDVASGVESAPGVKDVARMAAFISTAKATEPSRGEG